MIGKVDHAGRALLTVQLCRSPHAPTSEISVWIDKGFTGELVLPRSQIDDLSLPLTGTVSATLADGSRAVLTTHECFVHWFDEVRRLEVVANDGTCPLLGVGLLLERRLAIDYPAGHLSLE
jgi:predicted aspartyl protease